MSTMRWPKPEYLLKGLFLGALLFAALQEATPPAPDQPAPGWPALGQVTLLMLAGLVVGLVLAAVRKLREGYKVNGRVPAFLVFLLLESPGLVYAGILLGLIAGSYTLGVGRRAEDTRLWITTALGGVVLGLVFSSLRDVRHRLARLGLGLLLAVLLGGGALAWLGQLDHLIPAEHMPSWLKSPFPEGVTPNLDVFAVQILLGIPFFYLLTFSGHEEESEVEIGAVCAVLGLALGMLLRDPPNPALRSLPLLVPLGLYVFYTIRVLPGLRVFKHTFRGLGYARAGMHRQSLLAFRRALQLAPQNQAARNGYWNVHCALDLDRLAGDPQTLALVDFDLCLDRAGSLLLQPNPSPDKLAEAHRLLNLVLSQRPTMKAPVAYWRAVAYTHARDLDRAAAELEQVLDPSHAGAHDPQRRAVLFPAWQLALLLHDGLRQRVGLPQLKKPGRRMEAIGVVERHMAEQPEDAAAWGLKRLFYQDVTEAEYEEATPGAGLPVEHFDHAYVQQLGLALINDPGRWQRGGEYLRLAARGLPAMGPSLFVQIAQAHQRAGHAEEAWHNYELAKRAGLSVGVSNLSGEERQVYFAAVKTLAEGASAAGEMDMAVENYRLFSESERSGVETLRTLAGLYEQKGDVLAALLTTERGLLYNAKDRDLLERKDRYYISVMPEWFRGHPERVPSGFDLAYCVNKARTLLNQREIDLDTLDWAQHLADLAYAVKPEGVTARLLLARAKLRRGEKEQAVQVLEDLREHKPERFADDDQDSWYAAARLLGDLYLNDYSRGDLALACYKEYRQSSKSGADTLYKMGQAYEMLGDLPHAAKAYEQVAAYEGHPLVYEARSALSRVKQAQPS
jgi:tetratricopeptide (TPR) repeat protein